MTRQAGYLASNAASMSARNVEHIRDMAVALTKRPAAGHTIARRTEIITSFAIATTVMRLLKAALVRGPVSAIGIGDGSVVLVASGKRMRLRGTLRLVPSLLLAGMRRA